MHSRVCWIFTIFRHLPILNPICIFIICQHTYTENICLMNWNECNGLMDCNTFAMPIEIHRYKKLIFTIEHFDELWLKFFGFVFCNTMCTVLLFFFIIAKSELCMTCFFKMPFHFTIYAHGVIIHLHRFPLQFIFIL